MTKLKTLWIISSFTLCSLVLADFSGHHGHHGHHDHHEHHDHHHDHHEDADGKSVDHHHHHEDADAKSVEKVKSVATGKLALPNLKDCKNRIHHTTFGNHGYFFSWENKVTENLTVAWFTGRNICRRHCMDLVSLESSEENEFVKARMIKSANRFFWTSGRKCNFKGCDREDLKPVIVKGWFWSGSGVRLGVNAAGDHVEGDWSPTGGADEPQPDNRELKLTGQNDEACLAVLNNYYTDGVVWHDIACYHKKPFVCEDSDELLEYMRQAHPDEKL